MNSLEPKKQKNKERKEGRNMKLYCCMDGPLMMAQYVTIRSNIDMVS
jgi:hypothetical protein